MQGKCGGDKVKCPVAIPCLRGILQRTVCFVLALVCDSEHRLGQVDALCLNPVHPEHLELFTRAAAEIENGTVAAPLDDGDDLMPDRAYKR
jgi:hypothetical protein